MLLFDGDLDAYFLVLADDQVPGTAALKKSSGSENTLFALASLLLSDIPAS
jgi:hypothetical protein